ncbi:MAG TPA: DNA mismatch repair protein MutS [Sandaracinaceae bacterium LLY-WYZ-13_1]|nr:DNA mismatch repair protein MutS [Sandaracinaceae bacterium LLY-WYZ-13_1]
MNEASGAEGPGPLGQHQALRDRFEAERESRDGVAARYSMVQLALFGGAAVVGGSGLFGGSPEMLAGGGAIFAVFLVVRALQSRVMNRRDRAQTRRDLHARHVARMTGRFDAVPPAGATIPPGHPYASDLDIVGSASLLQRLDTTHTASGAKTLAGWLAQPASSEQIEARQAAVSELAPEVELRQELEAAVLDTGRERLDADPFVEMMAKKGLFEDRPWLKLVAPVLPLVLIGLAVAGYLDVLPDWAWLLPLVVQILVVRQTEPRSREVYEAMGEKKGFVDAYANLFEVLEGAELEAPLLRALKEELVIEGAPPSVQMRRLDRWVSWYELRETGIVWIVVNPVLLWDLNCLIGIERWIAHVGRKCGAWFEVVGQVEALASLSVLLHQDLFARQPEIVGPGEPFEAEGLAHPLLPADERVANDVELRGPGTCLIVTGSNMAGKSTLLRAVGVNIALALAGGPVVARAFRVPRVRLRASMRIADSLQTGASYFQAELGRLRLVVGGADKTPPVFFLLDELLRGTNAKARHIGARAVVKHLLERDAMGLVATHDVALSELEDEQPGAVSNVHFTDVIADGVMTFDYRLRAGVVKTSNALRLLQQVGIEVEDDGELTVAEDRSAQAAEAPRAAADEGR